MSERYELELNLGVVTINDTETEFNWSNTNIDDIEHLCWWLNNENRRIADLEAKLAESEKLIFAYQNIIRKKPETALEMCEFIQPYERKLGKQELEINQLKQQLAEKEQAIEEINKEFVQAVKDWKLLVEQKNKDIAELEEHDEIYHNQLAIEQLEKVKEWCENHKFSDEYDYVIAYEVDDEDASGCEDYLKEYIDNQIKQLKEMK